MLHLNFTTRLFIALCFLLGTSAGYAESLQGTWVVQVGAYSKGISDEDHARLSRYGNVLVQDRNALSIVSVGPYSSRAEAENLLPQIRQVATDAYVRSTRGATTRTTQRPRASRPSKTSDDSLLSQVPANLRGNVVRLDGELHYKQGDVFTPLGQYLKNR